MKPPFFSIPVILMLFAVGLISTNSYAQISHGGVPISFNKSLVDAPIYTTPSLNIQPYIKEDKITDQHKDIAWRFGVEQFVNLTLSNSGVWTTLANGDRVWRLEIKSPNAKTINLNYSQFKMPLGATFFVYNKNQVLGAFTHQNNKKDLMFSTSLLQGNNAVLEYYEPQAVQGQGVVEVFSVVHGYRNLFDHLKGFNDGGACNVNAICDTTDWGNEIRASVMLLTAGNSRFCSGALVNNTSNDGTPFVLTARHCSPTNNNIFMFNYQSPSCTPNVDGNTAQTISGCLTRASDAPSDFYLVELSSVPPANYNVFYAGWSRVNTPPTSGTAIHYPRLDVKKISHDTDPLVESGYYSAGNDHWEVIDWNSGTTEGGSSGSPLFDQNHRVVGQLHGGNAACGNDEFDYYGKFSYSWDNNPTNSKQLKFWLDPTNTGAMVIDGYDPQGPSLNNDVALLNVGGIQTIVCGDSITPKISLRNNGAANLTSLTIDYELDGGGTTSYNWTGNLSTYAIDIIDLPTTYIANGTHTFSVSLTNPNAVADQNPLNNNRLINFNSNETPLFADLTLKTDNFGSEISWYVKDTNTGIVAATSSGYPDVAGGQTTTETLCLYNGCFTFVLKDAAGDGYCCAFGTGNMHLLNNANGDTLVVENSNSFVGDSLAFTFCMGSSNINELAKNEFKLYPNPSNGTFTILRNQTNRANVIIYNVLGKEVYALANTSEKEIQLDLTPLNKGIYFIAIVSDNQKTVKKLIVN